MALFNIQNPFKRKDLTSGGGYSGGGGGSWGDNSKINYNPQSSVATNATKLPTTVTAVNVTANQRQPTTPTPKPTTPTVNPFAPKPLDTSGMSNIYNNQKQQQKNYLDQTTGYINQVANLNNQALQSQIPMAQDAFNRFKTNTEQSVADQQAQGDRAKMSAEEQFGSAQKQGAMTRQESENRIRNQYAGNNAIDSYGAGSYRAASSQLEGQFNQFTQQNIQNKVDQISQIDSEILRFSNEAKNLIADQEAQLTQLINNINSQVGLNEAQKNYAIQTAQMQYQEKVGEIDAYLQGLEIQKQQLTQEANQNWQLLQSLSPTFKATGQPTTQEDYMFMQTQPNMYEQMFGTYADRQKANGSNLTEKQQAYQSASSLADTAMNLLSGGNVSTGFGNKTLGSIGETLGTNSQSQQQYRSTIALLRTAVKNAMLGANMSPQEMESINAAIPEFNDAPTTARTKLETLKQILPVLSGTVSSVNLGNNQTGLQSFIEQ